MKYLLASKKCCFVLSRRESLYFSAQTTLGNGITTKTRKTRVYILLGNSLISSFTWMFHKVRFLPLPVMIQLVHTTWEVSLWEPIKFSPSTLSKKVCVRVRWPMRPELIPVFVERHCESKVSCPITQRNDPDQGSNPGCLTRRRAHQPWGHRSILPSTLSQRNLETQFNNQRWFWICIWGKLGQGNHVNIVTSWRHDVVTSWRRDVKCFPSTLKCKSSVFKFERFSKSRVFDPD